MAPWYSGIARWQSILKNAFMVIDEVRLRTLMQSFLEENKKLNLSAFRTEEHCWAGNILDTLAFLQLLEGPVAMPLPSTLIDLGTGGGFPLLPLSITLPKTQCIGIDATAKKIAAIQRIVLSLGIQNIRLLTGRIEDLAHQKEYRTYADLVTARAVAPIAVLLEYAAGFLSVGGHAVFWKSSKIADELAASAAAQKALGLMFVRTYEYELPDGFGHRLLLVFRKMKETPSEFPRKVGIPKSKPL
jgi:16S rRNA (guanine527-N7)-methyltransferase